jgi:hypothetical protein
VFSTLEQANEAAAAASGSQLTVTFPNARSHPIFVRRLGWIDLPRLRLWARPLRLSGVVRYALGREGEREGMRDPDEDSRLLHGLEVRPINHFGEDMDELGRQAAAGYGNHFTRDAAYFEWRYVESPRDYRCFGAYRRGGLVGVAIVGHTYKHGVSAGFLADLVAAPDDGKAVRALVSRAIDEVEGGADALVLLPPRVASQRRALLRAGFAPTNKKLRFIGKALHDGVLIDESPDAWHFTLGDFDFF